MATPETLIVEVYLGEDKVFVGAATKAVTYQTADYGNMNVTVEDGSVTFTAEDGVGRVLNTVGLDPFEVCEADDAAGENQ